MIEDKLIRVADDDPHRCQGITKYGQCDFRAYENEKYCKMHGGTKSYEKTNLEKNRNYRFLKYQDRINHFADNDQVKSLREEIGILRMILEETVNKCKDDVDLLIYSPKITELAIKIEKLVVSCHRLETSLGQTLDKTAILSMATRMVNIISEHISDQIIIDKIVNDIGNLIQE